MIKLLLAVVVAVLITVFAADNMHRVAIGFVVGAPVHVRMFFVIMMAFLVGCFSTTIVNLYLGLRSSKRGEKKAGDSAEEAPFF